jgi:hypothetical protein
MENDNYYVALDSDGNATDLVLAQGNYDAIKANPPANLVGKQWAQIMKRPPELAPNQVAEIDGWSQKVDENGATIFSFDYVVTTFTQDECLDLWIRFPRVQRLAASDWTQVADSPLSAEDKSAWANYRQALRDMTTTYAEVSDPAEIVWPLMPGEPESLPPEAS